VILVKRTIALIISVLFVLAVTSVSFATEEKKAAPAPAPVEKKAAPMEEKKAPAKVKMVKGDVAAVDAKAKTVTVKGKKGDVTAMIDEKTKIMMGKEMKTLADVKVGDKVTVKYSEADGKMTAKSIAIKPAEKMMEKKTEPAAKPAEKK
jgi:ABC-type lipoprotein release transport system permease subunit